jgi:hypothetical protein
VLLAQAAALGVSGVATAISTYVNQAAGQLILGLYDATCSGGGPRFLFGFFAPSCLLPFPRFLDLLADFHQPVAR